VTSCTCPDLSAVDILGVIRKGDSVAEWLAYGTQAQKGTRSNRSRDAVE